MKGRSLNEAGLRVSAKAAREDTRATNRRLVLQQLFDGQVLSRADLARLTALTPATISRLVNELASEGLVAEAPAVPSGARVGKPPTLLRLSPNGRCVVAADLSDPNTIRAGIVDLVGNVTGLVEMDLDGATGQVAVDLIDAVIAQAIAKASSPILGVGIGTPGVVGRDGTVVEATRFDWHRVQLRDIPAAGELPVFVTNDANAVAIAEYSRGGHNSAHLAVIRIGSGVGAGFVLNGRPFEGEHLGAGEIGHLVVDPNGAQCQCGHRGCLETFLAIPNILSALANDRAQPASILGEAARWLGVALAGIVSILDVRHIIVSGPQSILGDNFCIDAVASMHDRCLGSVGRSVDVRYTSLGDNGVLLGAGALVLSNELGVA